MTEPLTTLAMRAAALPSDVSEGSFSEASSVLSGSAAGSGSAAHSSAAGSSAPPSSAGGSAFKNSGTAPPVTPPKLEAPPLPEQQQDYKKTVLYLLAPALAFMATFNLAPVVTPGYFVDPATGKTDRRRLVLASGVAAAGAFLLARCVA